MKCTIHGIEMQRLALFTSVVDHCEKCEAGAAPIHAGSWSNAFYSSTGLVLAYKVSTLDGHFVTDSGGAQTIRAGRGGSVWVSSATWPGATPVEVRGEVLATSGSHLYLVSINDCRL